MGPTVVANDCVPDTKGWARSGANLCMSLSIILFINASESKGVEGVGVGMEGDEVTTVSVGLDGEGKVIERFLARSLRALSETYLSGSMVNFPSVSLAGLV